MKAYITNPLPQIAINKLTQSNLTVETYSNKEHLITKDELLKVVPDTEFLLTSISTKIDREIIDRAPNLKIIANFGSGFNNIDIEYARQKGIPVTNTPFVSTTSVAEFTLGLMLGIAHRINEGDQLIRHQGFNGWQPLFFLGHELSHKTLGIIGMGSIGQAVAKLAQSFQMKVIYWKPKPLSNDKETDLSVQYHKLDDLLANSDFVSLHSPLTKDNHHQFSTKTFKKMKNSAFLINAARGPIVDEKSLVTALKDKEIAGAALDVFEHEPNVENELKTMNNVILTPHLGNATVEARNAMALVVVDNVLKTINGDEVAAVN